MSFILESMAKNDCLRFFIYIGFLIKVFKYKNYMIFILSVSKYNDIKDINKH